MKHRSCSSEAGPAKIVVAAVAVRAVLAALALASPATVSAFHAPDTEEYLRLAREVLFGVRFWDAGVPEIVRTPGYPVFLLPGVWLRAPELTVVLLQIALSGLTVYLVFRIATLICRDTRIAVWCSAAYAFEPLSIVYSILLLTETLFTTLVATFLLAMATHFESRSPKALAAAAAAVAAAAYVRPIAYPLAILVPAGLGARAVVGRAGVRRLGEAGLFLLIVCLLLAPWHVRNYRAAGYGGFSAIGDGFLYFGYAGAVEARQREIPFRELLVRRRAEFKAAARGEPARLGLAYADLRQQGFDMIARDIQAASAVYAKGLLRTFLDPGGSEYVKVLGLYAEGGGLLGVAVDQGAMRAVVTMARDHQALFWANTILALVLVAYWLFALVGLWSCGRRPAAGVAALALYFLVLSGGPAATGRFRHPSMAPIAILAGIGAFTWSRKCISGWRAPSC